MNIGATLLGAATGGAVGDSPYSTWTSGLGFGGFSTNDALAFIPGIGDYKASKEANEMSIASAREQMAFQREMSNTGYQRATEDMKKAGLNPMLAYTQGPASSPGGAMANIEPASKTGLASAVMQAYGLNTQAKTAKAQIALNEATASTQAKQAELVAENTKSAKAEADINSAKAEAYREKAKNEKIKAEHERKFIKDKVDRDAILQGTGIVHGAKKLFNWLKRNVENPDFQKQKASGYKLNLN